jgi:hypothetical protein
VGQAPQALVRKFFVALTAKKQCPATIAHEHERVVGNLQSAHLTLLERVQFDMKAPARQI